MCCFPYLGFQIIWFMPQNITNMHLLIIWLKGKFFSTFTLFSLLSPQNLFGQISLPPLLTSCVIHIFQWATRSLVLSLFLFLSGPTNLLFCAMWWGLPSTIQLTGPNLSHHEKDQVFSTLVGYSHFVDRSAVALLRFGSLIAQYISGSIAGLSHCVCVLWRVWVTAWTGTGKEWQFFFCLSNVSTAQELVRLIILSRISKVAFCNKSSLRWRC